MNLRNIILLMLLLLGLMPLAAKGQGEYSRFQSYEITGRVRMVGNVPFQHLVITDQEGRSFEIPSQDSDNFAELQNKHVLIRSRIDQEEWISADHKITQIHYILKDPEILQILD